MPVSDQEQAWFGASWYLRGGETPVTEATLSCLTSGCIAQVRPEVVCQLGAGLEDQCVGDRHDPQDIQKDAEAVCQDSGKKGFMEHPFSGALRGRLRRALRAGDGRHPERLHFGYALFVGAFVKTRIRYERHEPRRFDIQLFKR